MTELSLRTTPWEGVVTNTGRVLVWVSIAFWITFLLAPIVVTVVSSFTDTEYLIFPPESFSLRWYKRVIEFEWFTDSLQVSLIIALVSTIVTLGFGIAAARVLVRHRFRAKSIFEYLMLSPLIIPSVVFGFAFFNVLVQLGIQGASFLNIIVAHAVVTLPLMLRSVWSSMAGAEISLEEAAQSLGATPWTTFWRVTLPIIMPGIVAGSIIAFTYSFNDVTVAVFLVGPGTQTLPIALMSQIEYTPDASPAAVASIIIFITLIFFFVVDRTVGLDVFAQK